MHAPRADVDEEQHKELDGAERGPDLRREEVASIEGGGFALEELTPGSFGSLRVGIEAVLLEYVLDGRSAVRVAAVLSRPALFAAASRNVWTPLRSVAWYAHQAEDMEASDSTTAQVISTQRLRLSFSTASSMRCNSEVISWGVDSFGKGSPAVLIYDNSRSASILPLFPFDEHF